jgi:hypothetical protein
MRGLVAEREDEASAAAPGPANCKRERTDGDTAFANGENGRGACLKKPGSIN